MHKTKLTTKFQTTMPEKVRKRLGVKTGSEVGWHIVKEFVIVDKHATITDPVKFLTSQLTADHNAVRLVKEAREDFA